MFKRIKKPKIGIIVEYNPFHNGHIYQLKWIKNKFPDSKIIIAMSHKFSQRGEYICVSWWKRKQIAKKYGVSKFIKLKEHISTQAAHIFANEAVSLLNKAKIDYLVFGSETEDISVFIKVAKLLKENKTEYDILVKKYLKMGGNSFPKASALALSELTNENFDKPNDILGIEYVKSIINNDFKIQPVCLKRTIEFHSENTLNEFASASKIRQMIKEKQDISKYTPLKIKKIKLIEDTYPKFQKFISKTPANKIAQYKLIDEGMENLFKKHINQPTYHDFIEACISKRYTRNRIKRAYLSVFLKQRKNNR
ncbi:nucleotidyltransferase [Mycoplasmopsis canis]|uniref:nucleotidyltransferase n=1 Tax=Mycoplasmopsis cynos TaxID=171284 RepID=UPI002AFF195E|nr:nucleotidyltransferase [Mycoplasmopsis cynos]WQQ13477.1 nucleotidyltransferase [Mycoplasmopsis cynos]WQQ13752.1 nucleotidyltransferase [Mycoplasmopsis cynos]